MKLSTEVYTPYIQESKLFYCTYFNFKVKLEMEGYIVLQHSLKPEYELLFCVPDSPFVQKIFRPAFGGKGLVFQIEVEDVESEYKRFKAVNLPIVLDLIEEPVNGKHFTVTDPNGIHIDIVQFK